MKILFVHNKYQVRGGEDTVLDNEISMLRNQGHEVDVFIVSNDTVVGFFSKAGAALNCIYSIASYHTFSRVLLKIKPDIVHVHNFFPKISPSVFYACNKNRVPVVHTLHNFRSICPSATLMHKGEVCEESVTKSPFWTVSKKVYKGSVIGTFFLYIMVVVHRKIGTWNKRVDGYIALTEFSKSIYINAGWPQEKLYVKPNSVCERYGEKELPKSKRNFVLYVGRLSEEKGLDFLLGRFASLGVPLKIVGDGPLKSDVEALSKKYAHIEYLGLLEHSAVMELLNNATCLVMASTWYEGFPMVIVEAYALGIPVVVPNLGNMAAVVEEGVTGLKYKPGDPHSFDAKVKKVFYDEEYRSLLSESTKACYQKRYTPDLNYETLLSIYEDVIHNYKGSL